MHAAHFHAFHRASHEAWDLVRHQGVNMGCVSVRATLREEDKKERERLRALKSNDMASYKSLLEGKKQERLQY